MKIDLSLHNSELYKGCNIEEVAGKLNLKTSPKDAVNIVGRNINGMLENIPASERDEVVLTGPMAVWSYLVVFHTVIHRFNRVVYDDGRNGPIVVAAHG